MRGRGYDPRIFAMHQTQALHERLDEQRWLANNPDFTNRLTHIEQVQKLLMQYMGHAEFRAWARENARCSPDNFTTEYSEKLGAKLAEIQPDSLFSEAILLEHRRDEILEKFKESDNQDELTLELAEIQTALDRDYGSMADVRDAKLEMKYGEGL